MSRYVHASVALLVLAAAADALAGRIYGSLQYQGKAVPVGTLLEVACGDALYPGSVGNNGRYSINVRTQGRCAVGLPSYDRVTARIISFAEPTRYDFVLTRANDGYTLRRR